MKDVSYRLISLAVFVLACASIGADSCFGNPFDKNAWSGVTTSGAGANDGCGMPQGQGGGYGGAPGAGGADVAVSVADVGAGGGTPEPQPQTIPCGDVGGVGGPVDEQALVQQDLDNDMGAGGLVCSTPTDCVNKCVAKKKYCWAEQAVHPYKPPLVGDLYQCIDHIPPASLGGSYTCLYRYPNGDACIFSTAATFGPIHPPAPPPLCVYKSP